MWVLSVFSLNLNLIDFSFSVESYHYVSPLYSAFPVCYCSVFFWASASPGLKKNPGTFHLETYSWVLLFLSPVLPCSRARVRARHLIALTLPLLQATHLSEWEVCEPFRELPLRGSSCGCLTWQTLLRIAQSAAAYLETCLAFDKTLLCLQALASLSYLQSLLPSCAFYEPRCCCWS